MNTEIRETVGAAASGLLPHLGLLRFAGADAVAFLQGQISNDARRLAAGSPVLAAYSTPQGRVAAILHLLPHSTGIFAILPADMALPTLERLRKFVMRSKVKIEDVGDQYSVAGMHGTDALLAADLPLPDAARGYAERDGIGVGRVGPGTANSDPSSGRYWVIGPKADLAMPAFGGAPDRVEHDWRLADIRTGMPQVYTATREMFVAQMLNLDLIDGISFTKGCFTGQEVIARTQHLGRIKRRLFRLRLPAGTWALGQAVHLRDGRGGRLTEFASDGEGFEALAVLNLEGGASSDAGESTLPADLPVAATELPLPYSLTPA